MRQASVRHPEPLVVPDRLDHQRVLLPASDGAAVVTRHRLRRLTQRTTVGVDDAPVAVAAAEQHEDAPEVALLHELETVRGVKLPGTSRGQTTGGGIVLEKCPRSEE